MIEFKNIGNIFLCPSGDVDGVLEDGRLVEFKTGFPLNYENNIARQMVAMANSYGGFVIFGVRKREGTLSVVGVEIPVIIIEFVIQKFSVGLDYSITREEVDNKDVIIIEIKKAESTTYFCRRDTSPARQTAYKYIEIDKFVYSLSKKDEMRYAKVFKYMTLDAFLSSLYCKNWRFFEPSKWNDRFEQRFYCARYTLPGASGNTPQLFATCLTRAKNSEAAWKVYSNGQGLGAHCLQLELDIVELRDQLRNSGFLFEEKNITYVSENEIMNLHKKRKRYYNKYFSSFTFDSFLNLLSLKRDAYTYEQELRLFVIPDNGRSGRRNKFKKAEHQDIDIDWSLVISKVRIDKKCSDAELASIQSACFSVGINPIINNYTFIGNKVPPTGSINVEFERFDIDDMPGSSSITIA